MAGTVIRMSLEKEWRAAWAVRSKEIIDEWPMPVSSSEEAGPGKEYETARMSKIRARVREEYGTEDRLLPSAKSIAKAYERAMSELEVAFAAQGIVTGGYTKCEAELYAHPSAIFAVVHCGLILRQPSSKFFTGLRAVDNSWLAPDLIIVEDYLGQVRKEVYVAPPEAEKGAAAGAYDTLRKAGATQEEALASCFEVVANKQGRSI